MTEDTKEIVETIILAVLVLAFGVCAFFLAREGVKIEMVSVFSGLSGTALGALGMKIKATAASNGNTQPKP